MNEAKQKLGRMFSNVQLFGTLKKIQATKNGQEMAITDFDLTGGQFGELSGLASDEVEVAVTISPSRRETVWQSLINPHRITADAAEYAGDLAGLLSYNAMDAARNQLIAIATDDAFDGWDDPDRLVHFTTELIGALERGEYAKAVSLAAVVYNLQKPEYEVEESDAGGDDEEAGLFDQEQEADAEGDAPEGFTETGPDTAGESETADGGCDGPGDGETPGESTFDRPPVPPADELGKLRVGDLRKMASQLGIADANKMLKAELIDLIVADQAAKASE